MKYSFKSYYRFLFLFRTLTLKIPLRKTLKNKKLEHTRTIDILRLLNERMVVTIRVV